MKKYLYTAILMLILANPVSAMQFDPGCIINDADLSDCNSMSQADIQQFLEKKSGTLADYVSPDKNGVMKKASEIIWQAANDYQINPKYILVTLQKEQSLIEDPHPKASQYNWAMGYSICDSCSMDDPTLQRFKGFGKQVDEAVAANRWYIDNANNGWLKRASKLYNIDNQFIFITNQATANLYNYTPHIAGNYNFWKIWNRWFTQTYPDGTLLQVDGEAGVWLIKNGFRRAFLTKAALITRYNQKNIIKIKKNELEKYELGAPIKYSNYSILVSPMGNVYMLLDDVLRKFASPEVIRTLGYNPEEFEPITLEEFDYYQIGPEITLESAYPAGALLQDKKSGGVYFVQDGLKYPILSKDVMKINYPKYKLISISADELAKYETKGSVKIKDGELVKLKDDKIVYIISDGFKCPIADEATFKKLGYKNENIKIVDGKALSNLDLGNQIEMEYKK